MGRLESRRGEHRSGPPRHAQHRQAAKKDRAEVEKILAKGALGPEALLAEVRELVAASRTRRRGGPRPADRLPSEDRLPPENP
jgi:hypothetical protein